MEAAVWVSFAFWFIIFNFLDLWLERLRFFLLSSTWHGNRRNGFSFFLKHIAKPSVFGGSCISWFLVLPFSDFYVKLLFQSFLKKRNLSFLNVFALWFFLGFNVIFWISNLEMMHSPLHWVEFILLLRRLLSFTSNKLWKAFVLAKHRLCLLWV